MCGIVGAFHVDGEPVSEDFLERALEAVRYRGPDEKGHFLAGPVGIGHTRLKIIDLETGRQPFSNEDRTVWLTLSGEIYNYPDLRARLIKAGHTFCSKSDAEVALHLYEEEGPEFVRSLRGMFALAIWDARKQLLLLARDRLGIQPLHYHWKEGRRLLFASEYKSLFCHPSMQTREVNPSSVFQYLLFRYVPTPNTLYRDVYKLPPGQVLQLQAGKLTIRSYWDLPQKTLEAPSVSSGNRTERALEEELLSVLKETVRLHLQSDVPVGVLLSGGVDSAILTALATSLQSKKIRTFSIGFPDRVYDESEHARQVAHRFGTDHTLERMDPERFFELLPSVIRLRDAPLSEASEVPLYHIVQKASAEVKVLLSGQGADELFGGYLKYIVEPRIQSLQNPFFSPVKALIRQTQRMLPGIMPRRIQELLDYAGMDSNLERWIGYFSSWNPGEFGSLAVAEKRSRLKEEMLREFSSLYENNSLNGPIDQMMLFDLKFYLPDNLLEGGDRMHMAASVEGRVPYLDHPLVEFVWGLPGKSKVRGMSTKYILKRAVKDLVPQQILKRRKNGFAVPFGAWLRNPLQEEAKDILLSPSAFHRDFLSGEIVPGIWKDHQAGVRDHRKILWSLMNLELWHSQHP